MAKLNDNTLVLRNGSPVSLLKGEDVPDWAKDQVGDHLIDGSSDSFDDSGLPPKAGRGSGLEAWQKYADDNGITYAEGATRDDIIAAVEASQ